MVGGGGRKRTGMGERGGGGLKKYSFLFIIKINQALKDVNFDIV